jgi:predicted Mrr-cat superfamily restriction endonuclease
MLDHRVWVICGGESGVGEHEEEFLTDGVITVGFGRDRPVSSFDDRNELRRYLED